MNNDENGNGPAIPALLTGLVVALGVALYFASGVDALFIHAICAPFAVFFFWLSWGVPTLHDRYARVEQPVRAPARTPDLEPEPTH